MWLLIKNMEEYKTLKVNKMSYAKTRLENDKRKNKPNIIFPIINTIFATILMGIVIFLFCTTDPQKIIGTILSRVQRFNFQRISVEGIYNRLKYIINKENTREDKD